MEVLKTCTSKVMGNHYGKSLGRDLSSKSTFPYHIPPHFLPYRDNIPPTNYKECQLRMCDWPGYSHHNDDERLTRTPWTIGVYPQGWHTTVTLDAPAPSCREPRHHTTYLLWEVEIKEIRKFMKRDKKIRSTSNQGGRRDDNIIDITTKDDFYYTSLV